MQPDMATSPSVLRMASGDYVGATVHVDGAASDTPGQRGGQVSACKTDIHDIDQLAQRRLLRRLIEQEFEILQSGCRTCLQRPGRNRVHSYSLWPQLVGKIPTSCL